MRSLNTTEASRRTEIPQHPPVALRGRRATERRLLPSNNAQQLQIRAPPPPQNRGSQQFNNCGYTQLGNLPPPCQYPQYPAPPNDQKLLTKQAKSRPFTYFAARVEDAPVQDTYSTGEDDGACYSSPADEIRYYNLGIWWPLSIVTPLQRKTEPILVLVVTGCHRIPTMYAMSALPKTIKA